MASTASTASTASMQKLTLRISRNDVARLDALRERRKRHLAQADGLGPPDRVSRSALALHYLRVGMAHAENAAAAAEQTPSPDPDKR